MKKNFLVLGGSVGQLPAIEKAQALGMKVVVIDRDPTCIGAAVADYFECVDTTDFSGAERVANEYNVVGSMTMSNDLAVPTSCYVNERLNLPTQGEGLMNAVADKYEMRKKFAAYQMFTPQFYKIGNSIDLVWVKSRLQTAMKTKNYIVKPTDSSGSRGISKITTINELDQAVQYAMNYSPSGHVIVEEFFEGLEFGALSFSIDGEMVYCFLHNDKVTQMVQIGHSFPSVLPEEQVKRVQSECEKALNSLGIKNGPCHFDIMMDSNGTPFIIEIGARLAAHKIPELIELHSGIDLVSLTVQLASGQKLKCPSIAETKAVAVEFLHFDENGILEKIGDLSLLNKKYQPADFALNLSENQEISKLKSSIDHCGHVIFTGNNVTEAEGKCKQFINELKNNVVYSNVKV
ncbi:ATP-grasp domain-containing protein [Bacillus sp. FJAT-52991]|uniref:ATP-grasp domain-containing protein n=1 Tax=Bacillus kandeliae TaxID=3129297 RepID=A0ABZ2N5M0_9BACI